MPMFDSDAEFEAYVAQQQAELTDQQPSPAAPEKSGPEKGALEQWQTVLGVLVPVALAVVVGVCLYHNAPDGKSQYQDPWDKIFATTAWLGGRKYDANANTLTDRMTFREPLDKTED